MTSGGCAQGGGRVAGVGWSGGAGFAAFASTDRHPCATTLTPRHLRVHACIRPDCAIVFAAMLTKAAHCLRRHHGPAAAKPNPGDHPQLPSSSSPAQLGWSLFFPWPDRSCENGS